MARKVKEKLIPYLSFSAVFFSAAERRMKEKLLCINTDYKSLDIRDLQLLVVLLVLAASMKTIN